MATAGGGKMADDLDRLLDEVERRLCRLPERGAAGDHRHSVSEEEEGAAAAKEGRLAVLRRSRRPHAPPRRAGGRWGGAQPALGGGRGSVSGETLQEPKILRFGNGNAGRRSTNIPYRPYF